MKIRFLLCALIIIIVTSCNKYNKNEDVKMIKDTVWATVKAHNRSWTVLEDLNEQAKYIHDDILIITPSDKHPIMGKKEYLASYKKWNDAAMVHFFKEIDPKINIFGDGTSAVVVYEADMAYNYNGKEGTFKGRDMFFLVKEKGKWLIAANQFSSFPDNSN